MKNKPWNYKGITDQIKFCLDCNTRISWHATRCGSCNQKNRIKVNGLPKNFGTPGHSLNSTNWRGGKPNCIDCGKKLSARHCKRCTVCCKIGKNNPMYGSARFGANNPNWKGGHCRLPYPVEFNESLKERIIIRDGSKCQGQDCTITRDEHLLIYDRDIEVHHIDYNKQNCSQDNLITTCKQCNVRANYDKVYWQEYYTEKMRV